MTVELSLDEFVALLQKTPVIIAWNPWLKVKLGKRVVVFPSLSEFRIAVNRLHPLADMPTVIFADQNEAISSGHAFLPKVQCTYDPFKDPEFEFLLVQEFHDLCLMPGVFKQSKVPDYFVESVESSQPAVAVFMVVDGLSFADLPGDSVLPCLVDGVSLTPEGMRRLVGKPHIAERLFEGGFSNRVGFSYWDRHNELADQLFFTFTKGQLRKVEGFQEILEWFETERLEERTYVQIVRTGLDGYTHNHRDRPPKEHLLNAIRKDVEDLVDRLRKMRLTFVLFVTADHGILWDCDFPEEAEFLEEGTVPVRYYREKENIPENLRQLGVWHPRDNTFSLPVTHYRRRLRSTEWGCHGGVSVAESFVPLLRVFG